MAKSESNHITSCTISWENKEDILSVVTKVLQTEIHVRLYNSGELITGSLRYVLKENVSEQFVVQSSHRHMAQRLRRYSLE